MKKIFKVLPALAAILMLVPTASAQRNVPYHEKGGVAYNKYVTSDKPDDDGQYTIHLETFTTGEVHVDRKSVPSDIVLVLDLSGSMRYDYRRSDLTLDEQLIHERPKTGNNVKYCYERAYNVKDLPRKDIDYIANAFGQNYINRYYKDTDGSFYAVKNEKAGSYYRLYFQKTGSSTKYYLSGTADDADGGVTTTAPNNVTNTTTAIWEGRLYRYPFRIEVLQEAVNSFIDKIAQNDAEQVRPFLEPGVKGNQISIVRFSGDGTPAATLPLNTDGSVKETESGGGTATFVRKRFTTVDSNTNITALHNAVNSLSTEGNTPHDSGMRLAQLLLQNLEQNGMPAINPGYNTTARLKTVVLFTDGKPEASGRNAYAITHDATTYAYDIKQNLHGKIFSIGFNASTADETFLRYTSSEYPDGLQNNESGSYSYTGTRDSEHVDEETQQSIFYADAGGSDLSKIFESIAEYAGGNSQEYGATSMVAVDIVSTSFRLPDNADISRVKVYTAQCLGVRNDLPEFTPEGETTSKPYLAFAKPVEAPMRESLEVLWVSHKIKSKVDPTKDSLDTHGNIVYDWNKLENVDIDGTKKVDGSQPVPEEDKNELRITVNKTNNTISITGFDFAQCWCGLDTEHENSEDYDETDPNYQYHVPGYRGFKLIIEFPIKITEDAVGGPNVNTNLPGSGLYMTDEDGNKIGDPIILYPQPELLVPVNLWIQKKGLKKGESATFTIERRDAADPDDPYVYFTDVLVTGKPDNSPVMVKLLNLDPSYYYRIKEKGWSWSYSNQKDDQGILMTEDGKLASTEVNTHNPIIIVNTKKDETPKHAESVVNNNFLTHQPVTTSSKDHTYTTTPTP